MTLLPTERNLTHHTHSTDNSGQSPSHTVTFHYPDCTRVFDGKNWTVRPQDMWYRQNIRGATL